MRDKQCKVTVNIDQVSYEYIGEMNTSVNQLELRKLGYVTLALFFEVNTITSLCV